MINWDSWGVDDIICEDVFIFGNNLFRKVCVLFFLLKDYEEFVINCDIWEVDENFIENVFVLGKMVFGEVINLLRWNVVILD